MANFNVILPLECFEQHISLTITTVCTFENMSKVEYLPWLLIDFDNSSFINCIYLFLLASNVMYSAIVAELTFFLTFN